MRVTRRRELNLTSTTTSWLLRCLKKNGKLLHSRSMVSVCLLFALKQQSRTSHSNIPNQELLMDGTRDAAGREFSPTIRRHGSHSKSSAPDAAQSMLRTTTKTGDIGQFSIRPSRLSRSESHIPTTRRRSSSFDSSILSAARQRSRPHRSKASVPNEQDKCLHS
jgi:hypothetical protein